MKNLETVFRHNEFRFLRGGTPDDGGASPLHDDRMPPCFDGVRRQIRRWYSFHQSAYVYSEPERPKE